MFVDKYIVELLNSPEASRSPSHHVYYEESGSKLNYSESNHYPWGRE